MASKRGSNESSNTGLIVALVFFVLATIGLGVGTYMGYAGKTEAEKATKTAQTEKTAADRKTREEQAQKLAVLIAAGADQPADRQTFNGLRNDFTPTIQTQLNGLKHLPKWDLATQGDRPPKTYDSMIDDLQKAFNLQLANAKAKENELEEEKKKAAETIQDLQNKNKTEQDNRKKANDAVVAETSRKAAGSTENSAEIEKLSKQVAQLTLDKQNQETDLSRQIKELQSRLDTYHKVRQEFAANVGPILEKLEKVKGQRPELHELDEMVDMLARQFERAQALLNDTPKGQIIRVDRTSGMVYVNLGSADFVQQQLTFSVLPAGSNGKAAAGRPRKAAIELVSVLEPHLSTAKVIDSGNLVRDPLLQGDLLFNPVWSPNVRIHVALAGIIDLNGDGIDDTPDLKRALEKQGVVVDSYLDLKDRTIKGPGMNEKTTYLIIGESPVLPPGFIPNESNTVAVATTEILGKIDEMRTKARDLGIEKVPYGRFLTLIGYRLPKMTAPADYSASSYLRGGGPPKNPNDKDK